MADLPVMAHLRCTVDAVVTALQATCLAVDTVVVSVAVAEATSRTEVLMLACADLRAMFSSKPESTTLDCLRRQQTVALGE